MHTSAVQKSIEDINSLSTTASVDSSLTNVNVQNAIAQLGQRVTRVNQVTKELIRQSITTSVNDGLGVVETAQNLRTLGLDEYYANRALTIARTETRLAYSEGSRISFVDLQVEKFDVVGCVGTLAGTNELGLSASYGDFTETVGSCGVLDVPMNLLDSVVLIHHPNHSGVEVPTEIA